MMRSEGNHLTMLCDMSEIAALLVGSTTIEDFLHRTVFMVAEHLKVPVCSIYLYDERDQELVLKATKGLNPMAVDRVRMKPGEGLVGAVMKRNEPIREGSAPTSPQYKYFEEADEAGYESFLAQPIRRGKEGIGVIVAQHEQPDYFTDVDMLALRGIAAQLAGVIANARLLMSLDAHAVPSTLEEIFERLRFTRGISASEGFAFGLSAIFERHGSELHEIDGTMTGVGTVEDFHRALEQTACQLEDLQQKLLVKLPEAASLIFDAHHMILKDEGFTRRVIEFVDVGLGAAEAVRLTANHYIKLFSSSRHEALREKALDVEDLALRIIGNIKPPQSTKAGGEREIAGRVVIADILYPSDILKLAAEDVKGAILVGGGTTSHIAILGDKNLLS